VDPKPAGIPGVEDFGGKLLQSARWDHSYDLAGKRVAIIGTGASAVQIIPEIARTVAHLDVFQRTPIWVAPKLDPETPAAVQRLFARVPRLQNAIRAASTSGAEHSLITGVVNYQRRPVRWTVDGLTWLLKTVWYRRQVADPVLRAKLTPDYALGCKRPAVSNTYLRTFTKAHVDLVTDPIERVTASGVQTVDGRVREVDALILATGFRLANDPENYRRTPVRGRGGFDLATAYEEDRARSYEGISIPGLPNHFMIFGPYGWTGGTWHTLVETASTHIVRVIEEARRRGARSVEVRQEPTDRWTAFAVDRLGRSLWRTGAVCATAHSYYFDHHGDTPFLRPTSTREAWKAHTTFPLEDYAFA
jgi:cation diffusion facilitator CzcD-associated flavoprotein CzcO